MKIVGMHLVCCFSYYIIPLFVYFFPGPSLLLDPTCNKYCDLIEVSILHRKPCKLRRKLCKLCRKPCKTFGLWLGLLLGSSLLCQALGIVARI